MDIWQRTSSRGPISAVLPASAAFALACALVLVGAGQAQAASATQWGSGSIEAQQCAVEGTVLADADELAAGYVSSVFYSGSATGTSSASTAGGSSLSTQANAGESCLEGDSLALYLVLREFVTDVAANGGSTVCPFTFTYSAEGNSAYDVAVEALSSLGVDTVFYALVVDCPYELYWFNYTIGYSYPMTYTYSRSGSTYTLYATTYVNMYVYDDYVGESSFTVDEEKAQSTQVAVANAYSIVLKYASETNVEAKLTAYKDEICELTSYNTEAASSGISSYGGNPWELVWVFDGDESTEVVCEGYAKAFQYLCDITWPDNDPVACYTVTGYMGGGSHGWNIVRVDGEGYMVDVTNSDSGTVGQDGGLFLSAPVSGSVSAGYRFTAIKRLGNGTAYGTYTYVYLSRWLTLYGEDILTISSESFPSDLTCEETRIDISGGTLSELGEYVYTGEAWEPAVSVQCGGSTLVLGADYTVSYGDNIDAGTATVTVEGCGSYRGTLTATFTIAPATQSIAFASETLEAHASDTVVNVLTGAQTAVVYESSDESVATVADDGTVSCVGAGVATITATAVAAGNYGEASASYTLTVTAHEYESTVTEPTCTEDGCTTYTCTVCGNTYSVAIAATGHSFVAESTYECTAGGYVTETCTVCGYSYISAYLEAAGHIWGEWVVTVAATTEAEGEMTRTCTVCGEVETQVIEKLASEDSDNGDDASEVDASGDDASAGEAGDSDTSVIGSDANDSGDTSSDSGDAADGDADSSDTTDSGDATDGDVGSSDTTDSDAGDSDASSGDTSAGGDADSGGDASASGGDASGSSDASSGDTGAGGDADSANGSSTAEFSTGSTSAKAQSLKVTTKTKTVKARKLKKMKVTVKCITKVSGAKGKLSFAKSKVKVKRGKKYKAASKKLAKKFTVNKSTGKITLKKGLAKGTYKVKVKVTAAAKGSYKKTTKTVTVTIKVK